MKKTLILSLLFLSSTSVFSVGGVVAIGSVGTASAQTTQNKTDASYKYTLLEPLPCVNDQTGTDKTTCDAASKTVTTVDVRDYIVYIFQIVIAAGAVLAVLYIVWGGIQYMSTDAWSGKSAGLNRAKNAIWGLILLLSSYLILRTVDPRLVNIPSSLVEPITADQIKNFKNTGGLENSLNTPTSANKFGADPSPDMPQKPGAPVNPQSPSGGIHRGSI